MNNNDKLDELFGMAHNEPSLISEEEVRNLLMENDNSYIPAKVNFVELIKGVPTMFKIGFALAVATIGGLISTSMFDNSEQKIAQNQAEQKQMIIEKQMPVETNQKLAEQVNPDEPKERKVKIVKLIPNNDYFSDKEANQNDVIEFKPIEVKGIQFITLSEEKLKLLGIKTDNKELKYWNNWGTKDDKATLCTLFVNGGLAIRPKNNPDYDLIPNPGISPRLITDNKGNRRVFVIDEDESAVHSEYESVVDQSNGIRISRSIVESSFKDTSGNLHHSQHTVAGIFPKYELENSLDSLMQTRDSIILKDYYEKRKSNGIHMNMINSQFENEKFIDNNIKIRKKEMMSFKFDSLGNQIDEDVNKIVQIRFGVSDAQFDEDESDNPYMTVRRIDKNLKDVRVNIPVKNIAMLNDSLNIKCIKNDTIIMNSNSAGWGVTGDYNKLTKSIDYVDKFAKNESNIEEYIKINKLIPILVTFGKVESDNELIDKNNFGFILWYDPTPELLEVLPKEIREILEKELDSYSKTDDVCQSTAIAGEEPYLEVWRSCSGAIEHLNVNPVPANSIINVNYSLTEARRTTISIHDMFGNVIKELQSGKSEKSGNYTVEFDISRYESGMYLISVQTEIGEAAVQRIVIER